MQGKAYATAFTVPNVWQQVYRIGGDARFSKEDGSSLVEIYERLAGVKVSRGDDS